jgi:hypothetical protein
VRKIADDAPQSEVVVADAAEGYPSAGRGSVVWSFGRCMNSRLGRFLPGLRKRVSMSLMKFDARNWSGMFMLKLG